MINWYMVEDGYDWQGYVNRRLCLKISTSPFDKSQYSFKLSVLITSEGKYHAIFLSGHSTLENAKRAGREALKDAMESFAVEALIKWAREHNNLPLKSQPPRERTAIKIEEVECDGNLT